MTPVLKVIWERVLVCRSEEAIYAIDQINNTFTKQINEFDLIVCLEVIVVQTSLNISSKHIHKYYINIHKNKNRLKRIHIDRSHQIQILQFICSQLCACTIGKIFLEIINSNGVSVFQLFVVSSATPKPNVLSLCFLSSFRSISVIGVLAINHVKISNQKQHSHTNLYSRFMTKFERFLI